MDMPNPDRDRVSCFIACEVHSTFNMHAQASDRRMSAQDRAAWGPEASQ